MGRTVNLAPNIPVQTFVQAAWGRETHPSTASLPNGRYGSVSACEVQALSWGRIGSARLISPSAVSAPVTPTPTLLKDISVLFKLRLGTFVVLSAVLGWFVGTESIGLVPFLELTVGGYLLTGASNGFNQIIEKEADAKMGRTAGRPLPTGRMSVRSAALWSTAAGVLGLAALFHLGTKAGLLGLLALGSYVLAYTPLKSRTGFSVLVGAIPGAIPPMLGYVAATGHFGIEPGTLFAVQFMWQFPHFWAIAWVAHEDYLKAGYKMLPFKEGRTAASARQILLYTMLCIPASLLPWALPGDAPMVGNIAFTVAVLTGLGFLVPAIRLWRSLEVKDARQLMFASFLYLPIVQLTYVLDKIPEPRAHIPVPLLFPTAQAAT